MQDLLQVGVISSTHGIAGEVKVFPTTDDVTRFDYLKEVILDTGREKLNLTVAGVKYFKNMVILKFKGIDNINDVEKYRGCSLWVTRERNSESLSMSSRPELTMCMRLRQRKGRKCFSLLSRTACSMSIWRRTP